MWQGVFWAILVLLLYLLVRLPFVLPRRISGCSWFSLSKTEDGKRRLLAVFGSGGHTAEMFPLLRSLNRDVFPEGLRTYVVAATDKTSVPRAKSEKVISAASRILVLPRAREVGQSWLTTILTTLHASITSVALVAIEQPDLVLCNGPGTCVPIAGASFLLRWLGLARSKIIFVESACRVQTLSMSGKILALFADRVLVQWEELAHKYPNTEYVGLLM